MKLGLRGILISENLLEGLQDSKMIYIIQQKQRHLWGQNLMLWGYIKSNGWRKNGLKLMIVWIVSNTLSCWRIPEVNKGKIF